MGLHEPRGYQKGFQALILIFLVLQIPGAGAEIQCVQEDPGLFAVSIPEYPISPTDKPGGAGTELVLPGIMKAGTAIVDFFAGSENDHNLFLSNDYWPVPILLMEHNNNTTLNLTA